MGTMTVMELLLAAALLTSSVMGQQQATAVTAITTTTNNAAATATPAPSVNSAANVNASNSSGNNSAAAAAAPSGRVEQAVPHFTGLRSCMPFTILVAAHQEDVSGRSNKANSGTNNSSTSTSTSSSTSSSGRPGGISITADLAVIEAVQAAIEDGILTLSLNGGFFTTNPINFIVRACVHCVVARLLLFLSCLSTCTTKHL